MKNTWKRIKSIISLNIKETVSPIKIFKLASEQIAEHLCFIYNLSFTTSIFWDILKIAAVTPFYKKDSKLECYKCRPISLLSNLDKIIWIKNLCIKANGIFEWP